MLALSSFASRWRVCNFVQSVLYLWLGLRPIPSIGLSCDLYLLVPSFVLLRHVLFSFLGKTDDFAGYTLSAGSQPLLWMHRTLYHALRVDTLLGKHMIAILLVHDLQCLQSLDVSRLYM